MKVAGQPHALAALPQMIEFPVPTEQDPGWAPQQVWTFRGTGTNKIKLLYVAILT